jgi:hypothetical protein
MISINHQSQQRQQLSREVLKVAFSLWVWDSFSFFTPYKAAQTLSFPLQLQLPQPLHDLLSVMVEQVQDEDGGVGLGGEGLGGEGPLGALIQPEFLPFTHSQRPPVPWQITLSRISRQREVGCDVG